MEDLSFNDVFKNLSPDCKWLGEKATHHPRVNDLHHCNYPSKTGDPLNWACTIGTCPYFVKKR